MESSSEPSVTGLGPGQDVYHAAVHLDPVCSRYLNARTDPPAGTGGFLIAVHDYITRHHPLHRTPYHNLNYEARDEPSDKPHPTLRQALTDAHALLSAIAEPHTRVMARGEGV